MRICVEIPEYDGNGIDVIWENNSKYSVEVVGNQVVLRGNKEALVSLAKQMLYLSNNGIQHGAHVHFNSVFTGNSEEENELIIEKTE
ncbi:MAG: hypothetical protein IKM27_05925 [Clostridia bacterium]|nr:hypothetical protein [Clostridia bacterium]